MIILQDVLYQLLKQPIIMKKFYFLLVAFLVTTGISAQCVIDQAILAGAQNGVYPAAAQLPHIVKDSAYDQTVQGKIADTMSQSFTVGGIPITSSVTIDSVRLDSIVGLPAGITWVKNPNVLLGGGFGCIEFTGSTSDSAGVYPITGYGKVWVHLSVPLLGVNEDTSQQGNLNRMVPQFRNYYLTVDSLPTPLAVNIFSRNICFGATNGSAVANATGGSPTSPYSYYWSNGATTYNLANLDTGTYSVTVTSGTDTTSSSVIVAGEPSPIGAVVTTDSGSTGQTTTGTASVVATGGVPPYTYRWNGGLGTSDSVSNLAPGTYYVTIRDSFGCAYRDSAVIRDLNVGIVPVKSAIAQLSLYPNPANSQVSVSIESQTAISAKLEVVDITGRVVYSALAEITGHYNKVLDTRQFSAGIYVFQMSTGNQSVHQRFVVTH